MDEGDEEIMKNESQEEKDYTKIISKKKLEEYKEFFDMFDMDKNGLINKSELENVMRGLNLEELDEKDIEDFFNEVDKDKDKLIDFNEFLTIVCSKLRNEEAEDELVEAMEYFDKTGSGVIPTTDFKHFMMNLGEKLSEDEVNEMIKYADPNNSGEIDYKNFAKVVLDI